MNLTMPAFTIGSLIAVIVLILGVLLAASVLPFNAVVVGGLVALLAIARLV